MEQGLGSTDWSTAVKAAMTLRLVRNNLSRRRESTGEFLMAPEQHKEQAALLRKAGRFDLARQHENLAALIARRLDKPRA